MAYSNWGAYVWKNGDFRRDCCDTGIDVSDLHISGHAVINCGDLIFEFYKAYFPTIYEKQADGTYKKFGEDEFIRHYGIKKLQYNIDVNIKYLPSDKQEPTLDDLYYSFHTDCTLILEYKGFKIEFFGNRFDVNIPIHTVEITTPEGDKWYCVYGMSFGAGYDNSKISKCHNKYLWYDEERKEYWYNCKNIDRKMQRAYNKDERNCKLYWIKAYTKDVLKSIFTFNFKNVKWQMEMLIEQLRDLLT